MRYLKPFNEAVTQDNIELCCVDLFDDDFELRSHSQTGVTTVQLMKNIISLLPEGRSNVHDVIDKHSSNYRQGRITISGKNFDHITTENNRDLTDKENKLISQVSDTANLLRHYSTTKDNSLDRIDIMIINRGIQDPMTFQYTKFITQINIIFYL